MIRRFLSRHRLEILIVVLILLVAAFALVSTIPTPSTKRYKVTHCRSDNQVKQWVTNQIITHESSVRFYTKEGQWVAVYGNVVVEEIQPE